MDRSFRSACLDRSAWIGVLLTVLGSEFRSACLDRRSSRRAWIGVQIGVLGSAFFSPCLDRSSDRRPGIGVLLGVLGSEFRSASWDCRSSRRAWIGVSDRHRAPCLDRHACISAVLRAWIGVLGSGPCSVLRSACSLLGSKFQSLEERRGVRWKREERSGVK
ncbi:hypothetical protein SO802_030882 [Lithocarpus litseifolius]|uniref:Uncharacterized protein n=1 Tax=Lithocarpus litseifolius TaxID=425828 RepID=A0AAW2BKS4_9ROSI